MNNKDIESRVFSRNTHLNYLYNNNTNTISFNDDNIFIDFSDIDNVNILLSSNSIVKVGDKCSIDCSNNNIIICKDNFNIKCFDNNTIVSGGTGLIEANYYNTIQRNNINNFFQIPQKGKIKVIANKIGFQELKENTIKVSKKKIKIYADKLRYCELVTI